MRTSSTKNSLIIGISIVLGASLLSVGVSNAAGWVNFQEIYMSASKVDTMVRQ